MSPDREAALRDLLSAITELLTVPRPASRDDGGEAARLLVERADSVRCGLHLLLRQGPLDNCAVHAEARVLRAVAEASPAHYLTAAASS